MNDEQQLYLVTDSGDVAQTLVYANKTFVTKIRTYKYL